MRLHKAEKGFFEHIFADPRLANEAVNLVPVVNMVTQSGAYIHETISSLCDSGLAPSLEVVRVSLESKEVGSSYLPALEECNVPKASGNDIASIRYYAELILGISNRNNILAIRDELNMVTSDEFDPIDVKEYILEMLDDAVNVEYRPEHLAGLVADELFGEAREHFSTGRFFPELDKHFHGGLEPGRLTFVAARPGIGKTAFSLKLAYALARHNDRAALFFSLEMPRQEITQRLYSILTKMDYEEMIRRKEGLLDDPNSLYHKAIKHLRDIPLYVHDEPSLTIDKVKFITRSMIPKGLGVVVIDYLQLLNMQMSKNQTRDQAIGEVTRKLKLMSRELKIHVVCLAQLNRDVERRYSEEPVLADLRESGTIEQNADAVLFLYKEKGEYRYDDGSVPVKLKIAKNRSGPLGHIEYKFYGKQTNFKEIVPSSF